MSVKSRKNKENPLFFRRFGVRAFARAARKRPYAFH